MNTIIGSTIFALVLACTVGVAYANSETDSATAVPAPFYNDANGPDALDPQAPQATSYYLRVPGSAFLPRTSATSFGYSGGGCISSSTAAGIFATDLQIPQGATITFVRTYYYNQGVSGSIATFLTDYDGAGAYTEYTNSRPRRPRGTCPI